MDIQSKERAAQDREQLIESLKLGRDRRFAEMVTVMIGLAAETHPDEIRRALSTVFDMSEWFGQVEDLNKKARAVYSNILEAREENQELRKELAALRKQLEAVEATQSKIRRWLLAYVRPMADWFRKGKKR